MDTGSPGDEPEKMAGISLSSFSTGAILQDPVRLLQVGTSCVLIFDVM
jgi:hypothetical protein